MLQAAAQLSCMSTMLKFRRLLSRTLHLISAGNNLIQSAACHTRTMPPDTCHRFKLNLLINLFCCQFTQNLQLLQRICSWLSFHDHTSHEKMWGVIPFDGAMRGIRKVGGVLVGASPTFFGFSLQWMKWKEKKVVGAWSCTVATAYYKCCILITFHLQPACQYQFVVREVL